MVGSTVLWLLVWLVWGAPVFIHGHHESWLIAGVACLALDVVYALRRHEA